MREWSITVLEGKGFGYDLYQTATLDRVAVCHEFNMIYLRIGSEECKLCTIVFELFVQVKFI